MEHQLDQTRPLSGSSSNRLHIIAEVTGSSPVPPTIVYGRQNSYLLLRRPSCPDGMMVPPCSILAD